MVNYLLACLVGVVCWFQRWYVGWFGVGLSTAGGLLCLCKGSGARVLLRQGIAVSECRLSLLTDGRITHGVLVRMFTNLRCKVDVPKLVGESLS